MIFDINMIYCSLHLYYTSVLRSKCHKQVITNKSCAALPANQNRLSAILYFMI